MMQSGIAFATSGVLAQATDIGTCLPIISTGLYSDHIQSEWFMGLETRIKPISFSRRIVLKSSATLVRAGLR